MTMISSTLRAATAASALLVLYGCADEPTALHPAVPQSPSSVASAFGIQEDVPAVSMDLPPSPRPWDTDDAALVAALEAEDGHAIVAFKLPASSRASAAEGRRAALPAAAFEQGLQMIERGGAEILHVYRSFGAASVRIASALGPELRRNPLVVYVEPRQRWNLAGTPAHAGAVAAMIAAVSGQVTPWGISMVRAPEAWSLSTGSGVKVLIIDTGVNPHDDLPVIPSANCSGLFGGCTDGPIFHGTHVAGSFFARDNPIGVVGVAHGIAGDLAYVWRACSSTTGQCFSNQIAAGIDAGRFAGVKVINMSLGGTEFDQGVANAVASAWATGSIILVASAGNRSSLEQGGHLIYPAAFSNVIGVSGVRTDKSFASSSPCPHHRGGTAASNHGAHVDLAAPFWALSTVGTNMFQDENQGWCGTSMAAPHVSGSAALIWAQNPTWTNQQVVNRLLATAEDRGAPGRDDLFGHGIVDAADAVGVPGPLTGVSIGGPTMVPNGYAAEFTAFVSGGTSPLAYTWRVDGTVQQQSGSHTFTWAATSSYTLSVTVQDALGATASTSVNVTVCPGFEFQC